MGCRSQQDPTAVMFLKRELLISKFKAYICTWNLFAALAVVI